MTTLDPMQPADLSVRRLFGRALKDDRAALRAMHELAYGGGPARPSTAVDVATEALRALDGPTRTGHRPAVAQATSDQPWVVAYVDQLLAYRVVQELARARSHK